MLWFSRHRWLVLAAICAFWTGTIFLVRILPRLPFLTFVWSGEQTFEDLMQREGRKTPTRADFAFIGIDQASAQFAPFDAAQLENNRALQLMAERPFPWSREVWALLLDRLFTAGARVVLFDLVFSPVNEGDPAFRAALDAHRAGVVLGANFDLANGAQAILPNEQLIPPPQLMDDRVGYVVFFADEADGKIRAARYTMSDRQLAGIGSDPSEQVFASLAARALTKLGRGADIPRDLKPHLIRFGAPSAYEPRPLWELFDAKVWHSNYADGAFFRDKVVILGSSAQIVHDVVATPVDPTMAGPALHLHSLAAVLAHDFLEPTPAHIGYALVAGAGLLAWLLVAFVRRPLACAVLIVVVTAGYLAVARALYDRIGLLLLTVPPLSTFLLCGLSSLGFEYALERMEKLRTRRTLERYVSKNLVKEILDNPDSFYSSLRGVRLPATILFSDIVGFTALTENADPEALVRQLNEYLSRMTAAVFENDGTLDKFIGDAVMAVWGNVGSRGTTEDAKACARTALAMRRELRVLNDRWHAAGIAPFSIGIGINHGDVLVGNIGSQEKADPTVIGDAVNLASRLEALTRTYGTDILVGESAAELIRDDFVLRSVARVQVKGKTKPSDIFTLIGSHSEPADGEFLSRLEIYEEALQHFRERRFAEAKSLFSRFLEFFPKDALAIMYLARSVEYEQTPPNESWNGVEIFRKK
ncbi:MAG: adenylate/guanylate cyclase domain-containing protein [Verrucomicrobiota bacterium]|nr:adenylate/guanylate cyclase domain-containing protein [Verrucomicrobiota bacterium]